MRIGIKLAGQEALAFLTVRKGGKLTISTKNPDGSLTVRELGYVAWTSDKPSAPKAEQAAPAEEFAG